MAKRKRLSAPDPDALRSAVAPVGKAPEYGLNRRPTPPIAGVAGDAAATAALDEMSTALMQARREGRMILELPLESIQLDYLVRDRIVAEDEDMQALRASLAARGQQVPVEVAELAPGQYGLISGWRRCRALQQLEAETGEARFTHVNAIIRQPGEASEAYLSMIEENEIRVGLSYYERARIVAKAVEQGVFETKREGLSQLFHAASRAKRSKIGTFLHIVEALDGALRFPEALTERVGLRLGRALQEDPKLAARLVRALTKEQPASWEAETACLLRAAGLEKAGKTDTNKAQSEPKSMPAVEAPCPGISLRTHKNGSLTLSGEKVDATLRARLLSWLAEQG